MKRRDFISGLLGFLAAMPVLGLFFKKKDEDVITLESFEKMVTKLRVEPIIKCRVSTNPCDMQEVIDWWVEKLHEDSIRKSIIGGSGILK